VKHWTVASWLLGGAALSFGAADARAESPAKPYGADDPSLRPVSPERRNGLSVGASGGIAFAGASGYPNSPKFIGHPDYYSSSPMLVGWSSSYFLMGAFNDYVSFGPMVTIATFESDQWKSTGWGMGFRGEFYPLVKLVPLLADASVYTQLGFGMTELRAKGPYPTADGSQSFLGVGLHHEWRLTRLLGGHASAGPYVEYDAIYSPSAERHWATAGLRVVWYGGGVKLDHP
jgi:hypothetical protein